MNERQWDIKEVKRLKIKLLVQYNLGSLLFLVLIGYFNENVKPSLLISGICVFLWILVASTLYNLIAKKSIGTKTSRMVQEFDRDHLGKKRWKRRNLIEVVFGIVICVFTTLFEFVNDLNSVSLDFPIFAFPFIGACVGYNIGEISRIRKL